MKSGHAAGRLKPREICHVAADVESLTEPGDVARFVAAEKQAIERRVSALGLRLRLATRGDIEPIRRLQGERFAEGTPLEDPYVLFRVIRFGYAPVIDAPDGRIVACNLCEGYDDADRTSWGLRMSVDPSVSARNLGAELANYSCLIAMERGSLIRRAFVAPTNYPSIANALNHVGYVIEDIDRQVPGHRDPRFVLALPLTPAGVRNNRIDPKKVAAFMDGRQSGRDFVVVQCSDLDRIETLYAEGRFTAVALLKVGTAAEEPALLAVPLS